MFKYSIGYHRDFEYRPEPNPDTDPSLAAPRHLHMDLSIAVPVILGDEGLVRVQLRACRVYRLSIDV